MSTVKAVDFVASFLSSVGRSWVHDLYFLLQICLKLGEFNPLSCFFIIETVKKRTFYVFKFSSIRCKSIIAVLLLTKFIKPRRKWLVWSRKVQLLVFSGKKKYFSWRSWWRTDICCKSQGSYFVSGVKSHIFFYQHNNSQRERATHTHTHSDKKRWSEGMERAGEESERAAAAEWTPLAQRWDGIRYCLPV